MSATLLVPPAEEPVTLAAVKSFLRLTASDEDDLLTTMIAAARLFVEGETGLALITQTWRITREGWPSGGVITLPLAPVQSLSAARVTQNGGAVLLEPTLFALDGKGARPRLAFQPGSLPVPDVTLGGIALDLVCGYGAASAVPEPLKQAVLRLVAHWFEQRLPAQDAVRNVPAAIAMLYAPYALRRLS